MIVNLLNYFQPIFLGSPRYLTELIW